MGKCPEKPEELIDEPISMYHCPYCGMMLIAGLPHPDLKEEDLINPYDLNQSPICKK